MKRVIYYVILVAMLAISACASQRGGCNMSRRFSGYGSR